MIGHQERRREKDEACNASGGESEHEGATAQ